jgi:hypothetical protein
MVYLVEGQLHTSHGQRFGVGSMIESRNVIAQISSFHHELLNLFLYMLKKHKLVNASTKATNEIGIGSCITKGIMLKFSQKTTQVRVT